jgi:hypothetical protein
MQTNKVNIRTSELFEYIMSKIFSQKSVKQNLSVVLWALFTTPVFVVILLMNLENKTQNYLNEAVELILEEQIIETDKHKPFDIPEVRSGAQEEQAPLSTECGQFYNFDYDCGGSKYWVHGGWS